MNNAIEQSILETRCYFTWMGEDGIARSIVKENAEIILDDAIENSTAVNSLYAGTRFPLMVNASKIKSMSKEARNYLSVNNRTTNITAFAVVVNSALSAIIVNFFFKFQKTGVPSKLFVSEHDAIKWLNEQKLSNIG